MRVDESGVHAGLGEVRLAQQGAQEANIGGHTGDIELVERTLGALHGLLEIDATAGHLHQQGVEVGRNLCAHGRCTVQAHAGAARRTIRGQRAGIRAEAVIRVLGGDAALQSRTGDGNLVLGEVNIFQRCAGRDIHLGLDDVYAGDFLGHGVLHLHTRVHLDEDVVAALIDEEFHGARALVVDVLTELHRILADAVTQLRIQRWCWRNLYHLLVAALHRAVTLEKVHHIALAIGQNLHLDVLRLNYRGL